MTSLSTVRQEVEKSRPERGQFPLVTDAEIFEQAGFYSVSLGNNWGAEWPDIHKWCQEKFGREHYTWTGSTFWFENEKDAILFALKWG